MSAPYATRRTAAVNFGDRTLVRGGETKPLAEISTADAQPFTVYVTARTEPATAPVFPVVDLEWGHGGASVHATTVRVYRRLRFPVVASTVRVTGRVLDAAGNPAPKTVQCRMACFLASGSDGETQRPTRWTSQRGAEGLVSTEPEQVVTVEGYPAAPTPRWLMLFDAPARPADGAFPAIATPARRRFRVDRFDGHGFRFGVMWAASSTPMVLTFDPAADLRVDVEVLA